MFDVFYIGTKPNLFAFEQPADSLEKAANASRTEFFWFIDGNNDYTDFDFNWQPIPYDKEYTHVFPSQWHANGGVYFAPKSNASKNNIKFQNCQAVKHKVDMSKWIIPAGINTDNFDFSWHPNPLEDPYEYHFPTQWQKDGGPVYKGSAGIKYVATQKAYTTATQIFYMDFLNPGSQEQLEKLKERYPTIKSTRYVSDHLNVLKRIMNLAESKFVWVISSICDYSNFDFSWHPEHWQEEMIHCFPSGEQLRGDTFYINVDSFKTQMYDLEMLDWFNIINYCEDQKVERINVPYHFYQSDNLVKEIKQYEFKFPYAIFTNTDTALPYYNPCLWAEKDRSVESFTHSNSICIVPRDVKAHLQSQIYDYPYVNTLNHAEIYTTEPLDVVYISNGEPDAERWYNHLENMLSVEDKGFPVLRYFNDLKRVQNINGRMAAYQAAAEKSTTPWFFAVFAKLEVDPDFDWWWQPDYFQEPKHYIFHARNPVNGLVYGHQAMIAYNKQLVLETVDSGLDFTLSAAHEVVPILSGTAHFNSDPWTTWRTAFREVVKLKHFDNVFPTIENNHRLKTWRTKAEGPNAEWCLRGVNDAIEYYDSVSGDYTKLMLTYEWDWLRKHFDAKY